MGTSADTTTGFNRFDISLLEVFEEAEARLKRQSRYARPLSKGGKRAASVEAILALGRNCILELAKPGALLMPVSSAAVDGGIRIADRVEVAREDLQQNAENGALVSLYLMTLGYDQQEAFERLNKDYVAHHMHSDLATEALFAIGRRVFNSQKDSLAEGRRLKRISIQTDDICGQKTVWDVEKVQALIAEFGDENLGVSVTDTGCFLPLYSILGMTVEYGS